MHTLVVTSSDGSSLRPLAKPIHDKFKGASVTFNPDEPTRIKVDRGCTKSQLERFVIDNGVNATVKRVFH